MRVAPLFLRRMSRVGELMVNVMPIMAGVPHDLRPGAHDPHREASLTCASNGRRHRTLPDTPLDIRKGRRTHSYRCTSAWHSRQIFRTTISFIKFTIDPPQLANAHLIELCFIVRTHSGSLQSSFLHPRQGTGEGPKNFPDSLPLQLALDIKSSSASLPAGE